MQCDWQRGGASTEKEHLTVMCPSSDEQQECRGRPADRYETLQTPALDADNYDHRIAGVRRRTVRLPADDGEGGAGGAEGGGGGTVPTAAPATTTTAPVAGAAEAEQAAASDLPPLAPAATGGSAGSADADIADVAFYETFFYDARDMARVLRESDVVFIEFGR